MKLLDLRGCFSGFQNLILQVSTFNFVIAHVKLRSIWKKIMNQSISDVLSMQFNKKEFHRKDLRSFLLETFIHQKEK